jgi:lysyl-tRNA synthetase class 2
MTQGPLAWPPVATTEIILARSRLLEYIRSFFKVRDVMEVETPVLGRSTAIDPHLSSFVTRDDAESWYLQTSPEFHMKRLLAADVNSIYQVCKSFRQGETGSLHNPEFSILEWYRVGFDHHELMNEVEELVAGILSLPGFARVSYRRLFEDFFKVNPHQASLSELRKLVTEYVAITPSQLEFACESMATSFCLDLLMSEKLEPSLTEPTFVFDYPISQAALSASELSVQGDRVAQRFELYIQKMEIANGYFELCDAEELRNRFSADNVSRHLEDLPAIPPDVNLLSAMAHGLPECAGVALGIDRLLMLVTGVESIREVLAFPSSIA